MSERICLRLSDLGYFTDQKFHHFEIGSFTDLSLSPQMSLVGRHVQRALAGYGRYYAVVTAVNEEAQSVQLLNEFGDEETLTLAQVSASLQPEGFNPATDYRWTIQEPHRRKPTEKALSQKLFDEAVKFERELRKKEHNNSSNQHGHSVTADQQDENSSTATATAATASDSSASTSSARNRSSAAQSAQSAHSNTSTDTPPPSHTPPDDGFVDTDDVGSASARSRAAGASDGAAAVGKRVVLPPPLPLTRSRPFASGQSEADGNGSQEHSPEVKTYSKPKVGRNEKVGEMKVFWIFFLFQFILHTLPNQPPHLGYPW